MRLPKEVEEAVPLAPPGPRARLLPRFGPKWLQESMKIAEKHQQTVLRQHQIARQTCVSALLRASTPRRALDWCTASGDSDETVASTTPHTQIHDSKGLSALAQRLRPS